MSRLHELLKLWAEDEPGRCQEVDSGVFRVQLNGIWYDSWAAHETAFQAIIQAAVQEAIEARGWRWKMFSADHTYPHEAAVVTEELEHWAESTVMTEALLEAYLMKARGVL